MDHPFFQPEAPYEVTGQYAAGTTFIEGLVAFQNKWFLYYGAGDTFVSAAECDQIGFGGTVPWPRNYYYQGFDGLSVWAANSVDEVTIAGSKVFDPDVQWGKPNSYRNDFAVDWSYTNGLTLSVNGTTIFTNVPTPGFTPAPGMFFSWAARTSTNTEDARLDNISVFANANLVPITLAPPFVASGSTSGNSVNNAFDGNLNTQWQTASSNGWIQASCAGGPQTLTAYSIVSASANWQQDPQSWNLQGSNDGTNWVTVDAEYVESGENSDAFMGNVPRTFPANHPAPFSMYQSNITANNRAASSQLAEPILYTSRSALPRMAVISNVRVVSCGLVFSGTGFVPLENYYALTSTNLSLPLNQWQSVATNQFQPHLHLFTGYNYLELIFT